MNPQTKKDFDFAELEDDTTVASPSSSSLSVSSLSLLPSPSSSPEPIPVLIDPTKMHLPFEIIELIVSFIPAPFPTSLLYVSRAWYHAALPRVYRRPRLSPKNYFSFVNTMSTSNTLGSYVHILDLRFIIQSGKNSYTSRLLRRCSSHLEEFYAPQTSFGYAPLVSVRQCFKLRVLDLSLVSETVDLRELFLAIRNLQKLTVLHFPRSSVFCIDFEDELWPPNLAQLGLAGGISDDFILNTAFPHTIKTLSLAHCPFVKTDSVRSLCHRLGPSLTTLRVTFPLPALGYNSLDSALRFCPNLRTLIVSTDYITHRLLSAENVPEPHPLEMLDLDCSGMLGQSRKIQADDIALAVLEGRLPKLRIVRASIKLGWTKDDEEVSELIEVLSDREGGGLWIA
ncbi:hypothetical protein V1512DRAFT_259293 [Lipomyces arxii]|uniref:uncharacterized protein n=1 Tax=Lipomyces arxii TaxID=56418 RepID=UPI0034CF3F0B